MKKLIAMMLCIVLVLSLVACGNNTDETTEPTTEPTTETTEPATETTEATEEPSEDPTVEENPDGEIEAFPDFRFIEIDAEWNEVEIEPTEAMLLLQSLYEGFPQENRPSPLTVRALTVEDLAVDYLPTDIEGLKAVSAEPMMMGVAHFTSIITVPEGTDPQTVIDYVNDIIYPELRSKWLCTAAEAYGLSASGNTILFVMASQDFVDHCISTFEAKMAD